MINCTASITWLKQSTGFVEFHLILAYWLQLHEAEYYSSLRILRPGRVMLQSRGSPWRPLKAQGKSTF